MRTDGCGCCVDETRLKLRFARLLEATVRHFHVAPRNVWARLCPRQGFRDLFGESREIWGRFWDLNFARNLGHS
jgi:hypothetical protein